MSYKQKKMNGQLHPVTLFNKSLNRVIFDYLGPLSSSNNKLYILVAACNNTKYIFNEAIVRLGSYATVFTARVHQRVYFLDHTF